MWTERLFKAVGDSKPVWVHFGSHVNVLLNDLVQQVNVTEVEVSVEIEQYQRSISHDRASLKL